MRDASPLRPAARPRCVFSFLAVFFSFLSGIEKEKKENVCRFVFHARVCVAKVLGSLVVEFFLDFGNCMAMIDLRGFWIGFGLRGEGTDFSVVVICEPQLLLACCRLAVADNRGHGP